MEVKEKTSPCGDKLAERIEVYAGVWSLGSHSDELLGKH
jgi:hypothetical protein